MTNRQKTKLLQENRYVAEVDVETIDEETSFSPCLSLEDALRCGDINAASGIGRVCTLGPVAVVWCSTVLR
jgi:hypothetical protein